MTDDTATTHHPNRQIPAWSQVPLVSCDRARLTAPPSDADGAGRRGGDRQQGGARGCECGVPGQVSYYLPAQ